MVKLAKPEEATSTPSTNVVVNRRTRLTRAQETLLSTRLSVLFPAYQTLS